MAKKHLHLHFRMDELFNKGSMWQHRTLRTLFDPGSSEWESTNMEKKVAILRKIIESGESLMMIGIEYKEYYLEECKKPYVAKNYENGLQALLEYMAKPCIEVKLLG